MEGENNFTQGVQPSFEDLRVLFKNWGTPPRFFTRQTKVLRAPCSAATIVSSVKNERGMSIDGYDGSSAGEPGAAEILALKSNPQDGFV